MEYLALVAIPVFILLVLLIASRLTNRPAAIPSRPSLRNGTGWRNDR